MNKICLSGVLMFLYLYLITFNKFPLIIFVNGVIYHTFDNNLYLMLYDTFINSILTAFMFYYSSVTRPYATIGTIFFIINLYSIRKKYYSHFISNIIHVLGTQLFCCYGLYLGIIAGDHKKSII